MKIQVAFSFLIFTLLILATAGCTGTQAVPESTTASPDTTVVAGSTPDTQSSFSIPAGALKMGTAARFSTDQNNPATVTVQKFALWDKYEWKNTFWGNHYFNATPAEGNKFLILFTRLANPGTTALLAPSPTQFVVIGQEKTYHYTPTGDPTLLIKGYDSKQIDYAVKEIREDRYLNPDPNNMIDGYIIYEVPASFDPSQAYVELNLMGVKTIDWTFS